MDAGISKPDVLPLLVTAVSYVKRPEVGLPELTSLPLNLTPILNYTSRNSLTTLRVRSYRIQFLVAINEIILGLH